MEIIKSIVSNVRSIPFSSWKILFILSSIYAIVACAETMIIPAIPDIINDFDVQYDDSAWILNAFFISGAVMTPITGQLSDVYGKKRILLIIISIYGLGVILGGVSYSWPIFLVARALQGIGLSMTIVAYAAIAVTLPRDKIVVGQGFMITMAAVGGVIGLSLGGYTIENYGWHSTFFFIVPVAILLIILISKYINNDNDNNKGKDPHVNLDVRQPSSSSSHSQLHSSSSSSFETSSSPKMSIDLSGTLTLSITVVFFLIIMSNFEAVLTSPSVTSLSSSSGANVAPQQPLTSSGISPSPTSSPQSQSINLPSLQIPFLIIAITAAIAFILIERNKNNKLRGMLERAAVAPATNTTTTPQSDIRSLSMSSPSIPTSLRATSKTNSATGAGPPKPDSSQIHPVIDLRLFTNGRDAFVIAIMILAISSFLFNSILQVIPILSRNPEPFGYGKSAVETAQLMLPLAISSVIIGPASGFVISKIYLMRSVIIGSVMMFMAFSTMTMFFLDESMVSTSLAIFNIGYLFSTVTALNIVVLSTPKLLLGTSLGVSIFLKRVVGCIGPAVAATYMHTHLSPIVSIDGLVDYIPSLQSYFGIFLYMVLLSAAGVGLAVLLSMRSPRCQLNSLEQRGSIGQSSKALIDEISKWKFVTVKSHRYGGVEFRARGKNTLGHVHGDNLVDLPLSPEIRDRIRKEAMLIADGDSLNNVRDYNKNPVTDAPTLAPPGAATVASLPPNYVYKESGWVCFCPRQESGDISMMIYYFRQRYDMILARKSIVRRMIPF
jgi:predicted MFS family arabinose efflux permease